LEYKLDDEVNMNLKQKIREKLDEHSLSVAALEKKAGLRMSAVRNILRGQTKKPSAYTLKKIAMALNCEINDLLEEEHPLDNNERFDKEERQKKLLKFEEPELLREIVETVLNLLEPYHQDITIDQVLKIIKESYAYSAKTESKKIDHRFVEWMVEKIT
jgi:transcriptional regulator with XRE-family HTH domain